MSIVDYELNRKTGSWIKWLKEGNRELYEVSNVDLYVLRGRQSETRLHADSLFSISAFHELERRTRLEQ